MQLRRTLAAVLTALGASCSSGDHAHGDVDAAAPSPASAWPNLASPSASGSAPASASASACASASASACASASASALEGMALVPAGSFTMGSDHIGELDERPAHEVTLPAFWLDLTEVTNEAYGRCVKASVCPPPDPRSAELNHLGADARFRGPRQPVSSVSWDSARAYCAFVGKRLPTEAEWEKAARGEGGRRFPWGEDPPTPERAVFSAGNTAEVGTHPAGDGPYGHHDLAGNVWEWVEDAYDPYAYMREGRAEGKVASCEDALAALADLRRRGLAGFTGSNPRPTECERVLRGGAFNYHAPGLRSSNRVHHPGRFHLVMSGFRCACDAPPVPPHAAPE